MHKKYVLSNETFEFGPLLCGKSCLMCFSFHFCAILFAFPLRCNISNTRDSVLSGYPNTEKRVENTTRSGMFLKKFEVFE